MPRHGHAQRPTGDEPPPSPTTATYPQRVQNRVSRGRGMSGTDSGCSTGTTRDRCGGYRTGPSDPEGVLGTPELS